MSFKKSLLTFLILTAVAPLCAQHGPSPEHLQALQAFSHMAGQWEGEGWIQMGPQKSTFTQHEDVKFSAGNIIMTIHGQAWNQPRGPEDKPIFEAFAVLSYDARTKKYKMNAFRNDGQQVEAWFVKTDKGFDWGFESGPVKIRYQTQLTHKTWHEVGFVTTPQAQGEQQFFEMNLTRKP